MSATMNDNQDNTTNRQATTTTLINGSKHPLQTARSVDTQSVLKRLQSELMALMMSGDSGISAFPEEDNIFCWKGTISGSKDTVFEGTEYKLSLSFPNNYPFKPPKFKFKTEPNTSSPLNNQAAVLWICLLTYVVFVFTEYRKIVLKLYKPVA